MTFSKYLVLFVAALTCGCANNANSPSVILSGLTNGPTLPPLSGANIVNFTVNGGTCSAATSNGYVNKPCVSVTICSPTGTNCQTIDDILLDTGSYGLRVFSSVLSTALASSLTQVTQGGQPLTECVNFVDNSSDWGPVETAQVQLGGEPAVTTSIQVIDSTFGNSANYCSGADASPTAAGFNGILGVGLFAQDCGYGCTTSSSGSLYYTCSSSSPSASCNETTASLSQQVTNPVALLPTDNNGVIIELPSVVIGGLPSTAGYLVLGIGTEANNTPGGVTTYTVNPNNGEFSTSFGGQTYAQSFLDTGSNAYYFSPPASAASTLPDCGGTDATAAGWFCPSSTTVLNALNMSAASSPTGNISFAIGDFLTLSASNNVFSELGGNLGDGGQAFDWGLPFYLGRNVYVGLENSTSPLGTGPYWAY